MPLPSQNNDSTPGCALPEAVVITEKLWYQKPMAKTKASRFFAATPVDSAGAHHKNKYFLGDRIWCGSPTSEGPVLLALCKSFSSSLSIFS
jgi:hypothetical protein